MSGRIESGADRQRTLFAITKIVADIVDMATDNIAADDSLRSAGMDSLAVVEVKDEVDRAFGVSLPMSVLERDVTVLQITDQVLALRGRPDSARSADQVKFDGEFATQPRLRSSEPEFGFPSDLKTGRALFEGSTEERERFSRSVEVMQLGIERGWQCGTQLYVSQGRRPLARLAFGLAEQGRPMTTDSMVLWLCNSKLPIIIAFAQQWERGNVDLDTSVGDVIVEFGVNGKAAISFRHLLTHTACLRPDPGYRAPQETRQVLFEAICEAEYPSDAIAGFEAYYSAIMAFFVLGTAIEKLDGRALADYLSEEVFAPLDVKDAYVQLTNQEFVTVRDRIAPLFQMSPHNRVFPMFAHRDDFAAFLPGVNGGGSAQSLGRLAEALLPGASQPGPSLLSTQTREAIVAKHRVGMYDVHWKGFYSHGLGIISDGGQFGRYCSPRAFGYGTHSSTVVADPQYDLVIVALVNGMTPGTGRERLIVDAVYEDLGLDSQPSAAPRVVAVEPERVPSWSTAALREDRFWSPPQP